MSKKIILAYVPVPHEGYRQFFIKHADAEALYLFGADLIAEFDHLRKDLRALPPDYVHRSLWSWGIFPMVRIVQRENLTILATTDATIVMPDEDECRTIAEKYLVGRAVVFDRSVFLRWDRTSVLAEATVHEDRVVPFEGFVTEMIRHAFAEAEKATNLWRRVGAVIARDGKILLAAHNTQVSSSRTPYYEGDPRMFFKRGLHFELTTDDHAERRLIAEAARRGIRLEGSDLFITTFPCPPCGKQIAYTGIRALYFIEGYAVLDSERILRDNGVEIIRVEMKPPDS
ncbi:hypothetical protein HY573_00850 [Candidatus Parcubacteria bacterium]|nr:hypothetical protein [Candidatus Parcubacteria bacterium]